MSYEQLVRYLRNPPTTCLGDFREFLHSHEDGEAPFDWGNTDWLHSFPYETQLVIATLAVATNIGTLVGLDDVTTEINGSQWLVGAIQASCRAVLEYVSSPEDLRGAQMSSLEALADECDEFLPDPEMTLDGRLFAITGAACIAFAAAGSGPGHIARVDPWMALMHAFRPVIEGERDFSDLKLHRWSNRVRALLAVADPRIIIEFEDAPALVPLIARPEPQPEHAS